MQTVSGCLRFLLMPLTKLRDASGGLRGHVDNCRESRALSALRARRSQKVRDVLGAVDILMKSDDSLKLWTGVARIKNGGPALSRVRADFEPILGRS